MTTLTEALDLNQPLVFGHRGARAYAPMNTIPAFELALSQGADGIELDVWCSHDGALPVIHDHTVDGTTDGTGDIRTMTRAEIKRLDAGAWFGAEYAGTTIPFLDEVFEIMGHRALINVEIKVMDDADPQTTDGVEQLVADCIRRHGAGVAARVLVSSFSLATLERFHSLMPEVALGYLYYLPTPPLDDPFLNKCAFLHPYHELIDAELLQEHRAWRFNTWTVNEPDEMRRLLDLGVFGLITDMPDVGRAAVDAFLASR